MQEEPIKQETSPIEDAKQILAKIEREKAELQALVERQEQLKAEDLLSGKGTAGVIAQPTKSYDEEVRERVNRLLTPTGMKI